MFVDSTLVAVHESEIKNYVFVDWRHLDEAALPDVRIQRSWEVHHAGGGKSAVVEDRYSPKSVSLEELVTTTDGWLPLLTDPALALPSG